MTSPSRREEKIIIILAEMTIFEGEVPVSELATMLFVQEMSIIFGYLYKRRKYLKVR